MKRLHLAMAILTLLIIGSITSVSCMNLTAPTIKEPLSPMALEEKTLPPVFSNINLLRGKYRNSMYFPNGNSQLVFGTIPTVLETKFAELTINTSLLVVPEKLITYKVIRPIVSENYARNLSKRLGFNDPPKLYPTDNTYRVYNGDPYNDKSPVISIYQDGTIVIYYNRTRQQPLSLPSDQVCIDIARNWLKSYNLYPENIINTEASPSVIYLMSGWTESHYTYATSVSFLMGLDDYELFGMGAYFVVGEKGRILEVHINAPEFEPYSLVRVQKLEIAVSLFQDYLRDPSKFGTSIPECLIRAINRYIQVNSISLKYFCMQSPDGIQPAYAQPIYVIEGKGRDKPELSWDNFIGAVDAVSK